jgi:protein-L-isoaspartate(D-aspartate) O-methyltransferase
MVREQLAARGIVDPRVLEAMRSVPRHLFVPTEWRAQAYSDSPLPLTNGQTISQPYIVGFMTERLNLKGHERVLEVGTGSGYQSAVLSLLCAEVYSLEIIETLATTARVLLEKLGYNNVHVRHADANLGWPEAAPFDHILVTAAPARLPEILIEQLTVNGSMLVPIGTHDQELVHATRSAGGIRERRVLPVRFVPMTGDVPNDTTTQDPS